MEKKNGLSILKLLVIIICISSVIVSLTINVLFSRKSTPHIFGRYIYIVEEANPMEGDVTAGSALIAKEADNISLTVGDIVLCYPADAPDTLSLRSINYIVDTDDGGERYYTKDSLHEDTTDSISKDKIVAVCTGYPESAELGAFIRFAQGLKGILILLVLASVILVIFIIIAIAKAISSKNEDEEDEYDFYEYEDEEEDTKKPARKNSGDPLFEPAQENLASTELERKKMSIAENFSQKEVNHDSPYRKERERTMQFKAQKGSLTNTMSFPTGGSAETSFAARNLGAQSSTAPTADALREEMLRKTAEAERTGSFNIKSTSAEPVTDNTGVLSQADLRQMTKDEAPRPTRTETAAPRKSSTPDISDIINKTESRSRTKSPSDMSVDDLLKMIESEKNKI